MMDAGSWSAFAGVGVLGLALLGHVIRYAFDQGRISTQLSTLEHAVAAAKDASAILSAMTSTVAALGKSVDRLDSALDRINSRVFSGHPAP